jgi:sugar lactone lactonase YvrE
MATEVRCLADARDVVGESPIWDAGRRRVYWVDVVGGAIRRLDWGTSTVESMALDCEVGAIAARERGGLVAATRKGFQLVDFDRRVAAVVAAPEADRPGNSLNDGRCDRRGRFWAGSAWFGEGKPGETPPAEPSGALYRLDPDLSCHRMLTGLRETNTVAWSPDDRVMYVGDSGSVGLIHAFDYDLEAGTIGRRRVFADTKDGPAFHDGSAMDADGCLWTALWNGWRIVRYAPDGRIDRTIALPVRQPTSCCFAGDDLSTLVVTTARWNLDPANVGEQPLAGALLAVETGVRGLPSFTFGG